MHLLGNIIHRSRKNESLNILTIITHERHDSTLCSAFPQHTFYGLYIDGLKTWNETFAKCPQNYIILHDGKIPANLNIDVIISHHKFGQFQFLSQIANQYQCPIISLEHTHAQAIQNVNRYQLKKLKSLRGNVNLFITGESRHSWDWEPHEAGVVEHAINCEQFKPNINIIKENYLLTVCNQFSKQVRWLPCGFPLWKNVVRDDIPWRHIGDDVGFSEPAKNINDLVLEYQKAAIFMNTTQYSPIPMSLLEASACGCAILTTATCEIPYIYKHGETCLMSNNAEELREYALILLKDELLRKKIGSNAREMVRDRFTMNKFEKSWSNVFNNIKNIW